MESPPLNTAAFLIASLLLFAAAAIYLRLARRVRDSGGKVRTAEWSLPDLLIAFVLASFFIGVAAITGLQAEDAKEKEIGLDHVLPSAFMFLVLLGGIAAFLRFRGIQFRRVFGFDHLPTGRALLIALGMVIAAFPLVAAAGLITQALLRQLSQEQELVRLFRQVAANSDLEAVATIFLAGVVIAPLAEEFLFRGYFYGVFKRYIGSTPSALITAAMFAAVHMNLASLLSLFFLAICFTIAYEAFGSLLVPIAMHAIFNCSQLVFLYLQSQAPGSVPSEPEPVIAFLRLLPWQLIM